MYGSYLMQVTCTTAKIGAGKKKNNGDALVQSCIIMVCVQSCDLPSISHNCVSANNHLQKHTCITMAQIIADIRY